MKRLFVVVVLGGLLAAPAVAAGRGGARRRPGRDVHEPAGEAHEAAGEGAGEGAEHEAPTIDSGKLTWQIVNFLALVAVLAWFGGRALNKAMAARHEQLKSELRAASEAKTAAEARLAREEKRLAALEQEIVAIRTGIKQEAEAEKARLIELAEERARRIKEETTFLLDQQVKEAELTLRHEAARVALEMAEQLVRRSLTGSDQQRLLDSFVADVAGDGARAPRAGEKPPTDGSARLPGSVI